MNYLDIRNKIRSGDLLAWSHRSWKTWYDVKIQLVRFFTRSEYSHVGLAWVVAGRVFVIESVTPKVRIVPLSHELPFYWIPLGAKWTQETEEYAMAQVGVGEYSQLAAILEGLGIKTPTDKTHWECAKFVISTLLRDGINLGSEKATPSDVITEALKLGAPLTLVEE